MHHPSLSQDAALVVALAGTAMPFAHSAEDEAERWLRAMRLHGCVGSALQALGVGESSLEDPPAPPGHTPPSRGDVVEEVTRRASRLAEDRGGKTAGTPELLSAVIEHYGEHFDAALFTRGTSREELLERVEGEKSRRPALATRARLDGRPARPSAA